MRVQAIAGGIVLLILGALFFVIPLDGQYVGGDSLTSGSAPYVFFEPSTTPATLTFEVDYFSASSGVQVQVSVYSCGTDTSCSGASSYETSQDLVAQGTSASSTLTFAGKAGYGYEVYASGSASIDVYYNGPILGEYPALLFLGLGGIVLLAGLVLKPSKRGGRGGGPGGTKRGAVVPASSLASTPTVAPPPPPPGGAAGGAGIAGYRDP